MDDTNSSIIFNIDDASCLQNLSVGDPPVSQTHNIAVAVFSSLLAIVILIGNGLIIVSVCLVRKLRQPANYLIVSLAFSDFLVAFIVLPLTVVYDILGEWVFGSTLCNFHVSVDVICCATSILNLVMISIDRYLMITRPFWYPKKRTAKLMGSMIVCVWVLACLVIFPALFGFTKNVTDEPGFINLTLTDEFQYNSTTESNFSASLSQETFLQWTPCKSEQVWQITVDLEAEHYIRELTSSTSADTNLLFELSLIRANLSEALRVGLVVTPGPSIARKMGDTPARFIRIVMNDTQRQHFANTSLDLSTDKVDGKTCLISQELWFTIYSTLGSFYIPLAVMLFMYYKIYLEASRLQARQRARSRSLSDDTTDRGFPTISRSSKKRKVRKCDVMAEDSSSDIMDYNFEMHRKSSANQTTSSRIHDVDSERCDRRPTITSRDDEACALPPLCDDCNDQETLVEKYDERLLCPNIPSNEVNGNASEACKEHCPSQSSKTWCKNLHYSSSSVSHDGSGLIRQPSKRSRVRAKSYTANEKRPSPFGNSILSARRRSYRFRSPSISFRPHRKRSSFIRRNFSVQREKMRNAKATRTLGIIVLVFTFCWLPFFVLTFLRPFICQDPESADCLPGWLVRLVLWLGYLNSAMNPIIYVGFNSDLRDTFVLLLLCKCSNVDRRLARGEVRKAIENERKFQAAL